MRLEDLMERAAQYDENLARDIKDYVHGRKYGLVYEASKPEFVRMWKKPVVRGDIVNILPPRGVMEDTKNEDDPSEIVYKVIAISEGVATLRNEKTGETVTASVDDIVALARFDKPMLMISLITLEISPSFLDLISMSRHMFYKCFQI